MGEEYRQEGDWSEFNSRSDREMMEIENKMVGRFTGTRLAMFLREQRPVYVKGEIGFLSDLREKWEGHSTEGYDGSTSQPMAEFHRKRFWSFVIGTADYIQFLIDQRRFGIISQTELK